MHIRLKRPKYRVVLFIDSASAWRWRIVSAVNGQTVSSSSDPYSSFAKAEQTANAVARDAGWPIQVPAPPL